MPVVKHPEGSFSVHRKGGGYDQYGEQSQWDLMPPRERIDYYLYIWKTNGKAAYFSAHESKDVRFQSFMVTLERDGPESDWELVK
jgi:hypothetical protein